MQARELLSKIIFYNTAGWIASAVYVNQANLNLEL